MEWERIVQELDWVGLCCDGADGDTSVAMRNANELLTSLVVCKI